jgi:hypothetical protein
VRTEGFGERSSGIVASRVRWFAVAVGLLIAIAGSVGLGLGFAIYPLILIVGAGLQPRFPRAGRGLMCAGALLVSFWTFDVAVMMVLERGADPVFVWVGMVASVLLVALLDVAIVREEIRLRRAMRRESA